MLSEIKTEPFCIFHIFRGSFITTMNYYWAAMLVIHLCYINFEWEKRKLKHKPTHNSFSMLSNLVVRICFHKKMVRPHQIYSRTHGPVEPLMILSCHILTNLDFLSPFSMLYLLNSLQWAVRWKTCQNMGAGRSYQEHGLLGCLVGETNLHWTEPSLGPRWQFLTAEIRL